MYWLDSAPMKFLRGQGRRRQAIAAAGLCAVLATFLLYRMAQGAPGPADGAQGIWTTATRMQVTNELSLPGVLLPVQSVDVVAPTEGRLVSVDVAWGDRVVAGQLLARVASTELDAQLREAEAALLRSRLEAEAQTDPLQSAEFRNASRRERVAANDLVLARDRESDTRSLFDKGYVARMELEQAQRDVDAAKRQTEEARDELIAVKRKWEPDQLRARRLEMTNREAKLKELKDRQSATSLRAPIAGVVMYPTRTESREANQIGELKPGAQVTSRDALMTIGDTSSFLVRGSASEFDVRWLKAGLPATVQLATLPGTLIAARVMRVAAQGRANAALSSGTPEFEVQVQLPAPGTTLAADAAAALRVGITAKIEVKNQGADAMLALPMSAVRWAEDGAAQVRVRAPAGDASWRRIAIAKATADQVYVRQGLQATDSVWVPAAGGTAPDASPGLLRRIFGTEDDK